MWSKEKIKQIFDMVSDLGVEQAAEELQLKQSSVQRAMRKAKNEYFKADDYNQAEDVHWKEILKRAVNEQDFRSKIEPSNTSLTIKIKPNFGKYFCFMPTSDWHLGSKATDYERFQSNIEFIKDYNIPLVLVGDLIDNFVKFPTLLPVFDQVLTPSQQKLMMKSIFDDIGKNIIVATWGNHQDVRDEKALGENLTAKSFIERGIPYFKGIGEVLFNSDNISYKMLCSHDLKGNSQYNPNHPQMKALLNRPDCDIIVSAHKHFPSVQLMPKYDRDICLIQLGTVKNRGDSFGERYFTQKSNEREYMVMLDTTTHKIEVVGLDFFKQYITKDE